jgi:lipopolysaccharide biosynthesis glycosyltransferase
MKICITTTFDANYMLGGKTLFKSIKRHTDCTGIDFKVITYDPEVVKQLGAENCHFVTPEIQARYKNVKYSPPLPEQKYRASWHRYEMFNFKGYDRVICLDSDCICPEDISYLFSEELNQYDLISVEDHIVSMWAQTKVLPELEKQGLNFTGLRRRLLAGQIDIQPAVLIANKSIVNEKWYNKLLNYANTSGFTYSIDEGILNDFIYLDKIKIKILPLEWDYQDLYEVHCPTVPVPTKPFIVHCEQSKPFKRKRAELDARLRKWHDKWWDEFHFGEARTEGCGDLDRLAIKHKADKSSLFHNFAAKYDRILSCFRESSTSVLEIGVAQGQSSKMWADYFPNAMIHGADITEASKVCEAYCPRIKVHITDQRNEAQLKHLEQFGPFDMILDDGNHWWMEQILSFKTLFPFVKKGGIYIIEDSCTSYWKEYKNHPISCVEYFKGLVDEVNLRGERARVPTNPPPDFGNWEQGWHRREDCFGILPDFESIEFMNAIIVIRKRL